MRHRKAKRTLDRKAPARRALLRGLAEQAIVYEQVRTTAGRARALRPYLERLITVAKLGTLAARRRLAAELHTERAVKKAIEVVGPRFRGRSGGYTRTVKLGRRPGDAAEMAVVQLVTEES
jgi:large subunit ribosomal protein L17